MHAFTNLKQDLLSNILPYWQERMLDKEHGGFLGRRDGQDNLISHADKGCILNARILWTFSSAYRIVKEPSYREMADRAYDYFTSHFFDKVNGGVHWMLDFKGNPTESKKQIYAQAFAIYGLSEYARIGGKNDALKRAIELFELIETYAFEAEENGYIEALSEEWKPLADVRLSEKDLNAEKTMNTHLHILEAYTNLYRVYKSEVVRRQLKNLLELMLDKFVDEYGHFQLFFSRDWNKLSDEFSYGHDIEGSWLMCEAAEVLGDEYVRNRCQDVAILMVAAAMEGLDPAGGLMNEGNRQGITDPEKHWWPQAEAIVGLVNAYQITKDEAYLAKADAIWSFVDAHLMDKEHGEWFWKVNRAGLPDKTEDKAGPWKCPYHNGRAALEIMERMELD